LTHEQIRKQAQEAGVPRSKDESTGLLEVDGEEEKAFAKDQ
jgi:hypothetical protein